jgi:hypothetical protein
MAGRVELDPGALVFEGAGPGRQASCRIAYERISSLALSRSRRDRIGGRPALVIELGNGERIRLATPELGALHELAEALKTRGGESR